MPNSVENNPYSKVKELTKIPDRMNNGSLDVSSALSILTIPEKTAPDSLAEQLNNSSEAIGAVIIIKSLGSRSGITHISNNFYLTGLQLSLKERVQLLESFRSSNVSFFGDSAKVYQLQGVALDYGSTDEGDPGKYFHQSSLIDMYESVLRGSKLVENNRIAVLKVLNHTIEGYPLNLNVSYNSSQDKIAQFSMAWVVTRHDLIMENYVNKERLGNFYEIEDASGKKKLTLSTINSYISIISEVFNLKTRKTFPEKFAKEEQFFEFFGTDETAIILSDYSIENLINGGNKQSVQEYIELIFKYLDKIKSYENEITKYGPNLTLKGFWDRRPTSDNFASASKENRETVISILNEALMFIAELKQKLILEKINRLYGSNKPKQGA